MRFAIPIALGKVFQLCYNLTDTRIIGSCLGEIALASVGLTHSLDSLPVGFLTGVADGFTIVVARRFGSKKEDELRNTTTLTIVLGVLISVLLTCFGTIFLRNILIALNTPVELLEDAQEYFQIILVGLTTSMLYNVTSAVLRSIRDTVTPLCFLIGATVMDILLDLLLICGFHAGVRGAAFATVISQLLSSVACIVYAWVRYPLLRVERQDFRFCAKTVKEMLIAGCSMGFMSCLINIGSVALQTRINGFGNNTIVAHTATRKLTSFFMLPFPVLATAMATYCSQNLGAGEMGRIKRGIRSSMKIAFAWCGIVLVIVYTVVPTLVHWVTGTRTKEILDTASLYLKVDTSFYAVVAVVIIIRNVLQGIGNSIIPVVSSGIELVTKVAVAVLLAPKLWYWAIILAEPISWILMVIPLLIQLWITPVWKEG